MLKNMKIQKLSDMTRGWFVGNFSPSVFTTEDFEVGFLSHKAGEHWPKHFHKESVEINLLVSGKMIIQGHEILPGDIFILDKFEIADPVFIDDCSLVVVKTKSVKGDKYEI